MAATKQKNAVIYARYSSHGQTEQSIEGQLHDCHDFAKREGFIIIAEYIDRAQSGRTDGRTDFQRMIADAAKQQFTHIIVWKLDRFARNRYDSAIYKARLKKMGVRVISAKENIGDNPEGIIMEGMLESMAEYYSANLSVNIKRGQRETTAKGKFCGGPVPFGYRIVEGRLVADERTAHIVRHIFEQYARGVPKKQIVEDLNQRGVRNSHGNPFTFSSLKIMMKNPAYIGRFKRKGEVVEGLAEQLIDQSTFDKVQERLATVARAPAAGKAIVDYQLQGKVYCGMCGARMIGESGHSQTGAVYQYYTCAKRKKHHACKKRNEKKDFIEWYVVEQTLLYVLSPDHIQKIAKLIEDEYKKEFNKSRITDMERAISRIDRDQARLVDALVEAPKSTHQPIYSKLESLQAQKADMELELAKLRIAHGINMTQKEIIAWLKQFCTGDPLDPDFRRRIIDVFINSVYLFDDRIIVFYNIRGGKQVSYIGLCEALDPPTPPPQAHLKSSDLKPYAPPKGLKSEPSIIFVYGVLGCVFKR